MTPVEHFYESIPGNFTFEELYRRLVLLGRRGLEIGVANGRSASFLAVEMVNAIGMRPSLVLIDNSHGNLHSAVEQVSRLGDRIDVTGLLGNSWELASQFPDGWFDFVFIDGDHSYEGVIQDIRAYLPKVRKGGIIAGHDYCSLSDAGAFDEMPGVARAVSECFDKWEVWRGSKWSNGTWTGYCPSWLVRL